MGFGALPGNLARVRDEIACAQARQGLRGEVRIVAVTKGQPPEAVRAALATGLSDIGESRVQEALAKQAALQDAPVRWHLVGHLQTNKVKHVAGRFAMVQSLDSARVVEALDRALARCEAPPLQVLLQVNVSGEPQKSGCQPAEVAGLARRLAGSCRLRLQGLMTMAPLTDDERIQRRVFGALRELRDGLRGAGLELPELSMGMSADYRAAVAEGATMVRLGTVLFGERPT